ncbi:hypothetical protein ACFQ3S_18185 [Mucilaginibacter terrae]|uniref:hypothetical protein n=1 Tax=Mucilaginibacter terrae TaxID=1955052 RepID=UPI003635E737
MDFYDELNEANSLQASNIEDIGRNQLIFNLNIGRTAENSEDIIINDMNLGPAFQIHFDNGIYEVHFKSYICFNVINESFDALGGDEFIGKRIRIYSKSNFLDYISNDTFATFDYPGEFKHYSFITANHIINVITTEEPAIKKL